MAEDNLDTGYKCLGLTPDDVTRIHFELMVALPGLYRQLEAVGERLDNYGRRTMMLEFTV
ncbi:MAG: hypothetical protein ABIJ92_00445 [Candidatus Aenigmatarchaeota archaeon]